MCITANIFFWKIISFELQTYPLAHYTLTKWKGNKTQGRSERCQVNITNRWLVSSVMNASFKSFFAKRETFILKQFFNIQATLQ